MGKHQKPAQGKRTCVLCSLVDKYNSNPTNNKTLHYACHFSEEVGTDSSSCVIPLASRGWTWSPVCTVRTASRFIVSLSHKSGVQIFSRRLFDPKKPRKTPPWTCRRVRTCKAVSRQVDGSNWRRDKPCRLLVSSDTFSFRLISHRQSKTTASCIKKSAWISSTCDDVRGWAAPSGRITLIISCMCRAVI